MTPTLADASTAGSGRGADLLAGSRGGGSLLELGVYRAQVVQEFLGEQTGVAATGIVNGSGADLTAVAAIPATR